MADLTLVVSNDQPANARQHSSRLLLKLGLMAEQGQPRDLINAHKWMSLAALKGSGEARMHRLRLAKEMAPADLAEAHRRLREWLDRH